MARSISKGVSCYLTIRKAFEDSLKVTNDRFRVMQTWIRPDFTTTRQAMQDAMWEIKMVFESLGVEWFVVRGTAVAFMRYGANAAACKEHPDLNENDIDMIFLADSEHEINLIEKSVAGLLAKSSHGAFTCVKRSRHGGAPRDVIMSCVRPEPPIAAFDILSL